MPFSVSYPRLLRLYFTLIQHWSMSKHEYWKQSPSDILCTIWHPMQTISFSPADTSSAEIPCPQWWSYYKLTYESHFLLQSLSSRSQILVDWLRLGTVGSFKFEFPTRRQSLHQCHVTDKTCSIRHFHCLPVKNWPGHSKGFHSEWRSTTWGNYDCNNYYCIIVHSSHTFVQAPIWL